MNNNKKGEEQLNEISIADLIIEMKTHFNKFANDIDHIKEDVQELKTAFKELVKIERKQQELDFEFKRLISCCEAINDIQKRIEKSENEIQLMNVRLSRIEKEREKQSERYWKLTLGILEKLLLWAIIGIIAIRLKVL